ncbi:MAG: MFS transporter [candidate division WOR-3 bacterium]|nr:MFS transporter [candidate division WOR-3 bacterium]MCX7947433.1 MFS transporter [candidate division WOR-3 bacterium]MDW8150593.1 MFS transporter [candidate division WOR-3 bacterium]
MQLIVLLGFISLFADITYEGARSILGPYLFVLGASSVFVGFIAGFGEFLGYFLRIFFGYLADKLKNYWLFIFIGYFLNLLSVPLLAFANNYIFAGILILTERIGKAIRTPSRDTIISYMGAKYGQGYAFGLHELIDQFGAFAGPTLIFIILFFSKINYKVAFLSLLIPAIISILILIYVYQKFKYITIENKKEAKFKSIWEEKKFWIYTIAISFVSFGFIDFALISYHYKKFNILSPEIIAILYSVAMIVDAISSFILGKLFDKHGIRVIIFSIALTSFSSILLFIGKSKIFIILGIFLWGISIGSQESIMRAYISNIIKMEERATAFGIFNSIYGFSWFLGSFLLGYVYKISIILFVLISFVFQILGLLVLTKFIK